MIHYCDIYKRDQSITKIGCQCVNLDNVIENISRIVIIRTS